MISVKDITKIKIIMILFENISNKSFMFKDCFSLESFSQPLVDNYKKINSQKELNKNDNTRKEKKTLFPWINNQKANDEEEYSSTIDDNFNDSEIV